MNAKSLVGALFCMVAISAGIVLFTQTAVRPNAADAQQLLKPEDEFTKGLNLEAGKRYIFTMHGGPIIDGTVQDNPVGRWIKVRRKVDRQIREDIAWIHLEKIVFVQEDGRPR